MNYGSPEREAFYKAIEKECAIFGRCRGICDFCNSAKALVPKEYEAMRIVEKAEAEKKENDLTTKILTDLSDFEKSLTYNCRFLGADNKKLIRDRIVDILCSGVFKEKFKL